MNEYRIEHRVKTLSRLYSPLSFRGFDFEQWDYSDARGPHGDAWLASKVVSAASIREAVDKFRDDLFDATDRISVVSQCFLTINLESVFVVKLNDNVRKSFFIRYSEESNATPLGFMEGEREALLNLEHYVEKGDVFRLLHEAVNASSFYTRFAMFLSALEAMAGEKADVKGKRKETNKEYIALEILEDKQLCDRLFDYGTGVRNQLLHGARVNFGNEQHRDIDYVDTIYKKIVRYFSRKHDAKLNESVINPLRNPFGHYTYLSNWLEPKILGEIDFRQVSQFYGDTFGKDRKSDLGDFQKQYEFIAEPKNY